MINVKLVETYAKVLYSKASADKSIDKVLTDIGHVADALEANKAFARFLKAPIYNISQKLDTIKELAQKLKIDKLSHNFMDTLLENDRVEYIRNIYDRLLEIKLEQDGIFPATLTSARAMSASELKQCKEMLEDKLNKKFTISHVIDPSIIGGVVLKFGSNIYDLSVAHVTQNLSRLNK